MIKRYVLDTNLLISAALAPSSLPAYALTHILGTGIILSSTETLDELNSVLQRSKFDAYTSWQSRQHFLLQFTQAAHHITSLESVTECRDINDNKFLSLAVSGQTDYLLTGDRDLLILNPFRNIPILTAREFLSRIILQ